MTDWQPIETAPKDGAVVLLFLNPPVDTSYLCGWIPDRHLHVVVGWADGLGDYADREFCQWFAGFCEEGTADTEGRAFPMQYPVQPTHWMPLPSPPESVPDTK